MEWHEAKRRPLRPVLAALVLRFVLRFRPPSVNVITSGPAVYHKVALKSCLKGLPCEAEYVHSYQI